MAIAVLKEIAVTAPPVGLDQAALADVRSHEVGQGLTREVLDQTHADPSRRSRAKPDEVIGVSTDGSLEPRWSPDGKELFFRRGDVFMAVTVSTAGSLRVGEVLKLFEVQAQRGRNSAHADYAVGPDGRFLIQLRDPRSIPTQINVVLNWFEELKAKMEGRSPP